MWDWFKTLFWYEQLLWIISIVFSVSFFIQFLSTIAQNHPGRKRQHLFSRFFAFKNITAFFSMFGWVSISGLYQGLSLSISLLLGFFSGVLFMVIMVVLFYFTQKLKESYRPEVFTSMNRVGEVLELIGKNRSFTGKIKISIDGTQRIVDAVTDFNHDIVAGTKIQIDSVSSKGFFVVRPMQ
ncbi:MAG: hypothetical protein RBT46_03875 [Weeksellaceae bacterium]|jgi:membrane protein implicated in regulation of membrane protease activity|nr:hypothetical protein [Weeksellaceae bacterium]MDX9704829.1 hypothetical protein [Weeksellaceae bacterium]